MNRLALATILTLLLTSAALAQPDPYEQAAKYTFDQPRTAVHAIEAEIRAAKPDQLPAIEAKLIKILLSKDSPTDAKSWVCRQLRQVGSEACIPAVAPLLADKDLATPAQIALRSIPSPKVDEALRAALASVPPDLRPGVILTLGARRDTASIALLSPLASDTHQATARAAIHALSQIGGRDALLALIAVKPPQTLQIHHRQAMLRCTLKAGENVAEATSLYEQIVCEGPDSNTMALALRQLLAVNPPKAQTWLKLALRADDNRPLRLAAAQMIAQTGGPALEAAVADFAKLSGDVRLVLLESAQAKAILPAANNSLASAEQDLRLAALRVLGRLGDSASVPPLLAAAASATGEEQAAARRSLRQISVRIDDALLAVAQSGKPAERLEALSALAARNSVAMVPQLVKLLDDASPPVRAAAMSALASLADTGVVPDLIKRLILSADDVAPAQAAIVAIALRAADKEAAVKPLVATLAGAPAPAAAALLRTLARIPTDLSLAALRNEVTNKDESIAAAAERGLADWPDTRVLSDLLSIARKPAEAASKTLALRGIARLAVLPDPKPAVAINTLLDAMALAERPAEKKLLLAAASDLPCLETLKLAQTALADPDLELEAAMAVVKIAKAVRKTSPDAAKTAVNTIATVCKSPAARALAAKAPLLSGELINIAPTAVASSPDGLQKDGQSGGEQAAIDGKDNTYWDKTDNARLYQLVVTFKQPRKFELLSIAGFQHHQYAPRDFEVLCDGKVVRKVVNAVYEDNLLLIPLDPTLATTVELKITGYYGGSPAIRELGIYQRAK